MSFRGSFDELIPWFFVSLKPWSAGPFCSLMSKRTLGLQRDCSTSLCDSFRLNQANFLVLNMSNLLQFFNLAFSFFTCFFVWFFSLLRALKLGTAKERLRQTAVAVLKCKLSLSEPPPLFKRPLSCSFPLSLQINYSNTLIIALTFTLELSADCRTVLRRSKDTSIEHVMAIHVGQPHTSNLYYSLNLSTAVQICEFSYI